MRMFGILVAGILLSPVALAQEVATTTAPGKIALSVAGDAEARHDQAIADAVKLIADGKFQRALDEKLTPLIREIEAEPRKDNPRLYSVRDPGEALLYMAMAAAAKDGGSQPRPAVALGYAYGYAYYLSAYAQTELKHLVEAEALLRKAVELAPMNSQFVGELAYHLQITGDSAGALEMFKSAETAAEFSPDRAKVPDKTRALRGQGYALVELGMPEEAEAAYKAALKLDPNDRKSQGELEYIRQQKGKR